jgi:hypothetical protein
MPIHPLTTALAILLFLSPSVFGREQREDAKIAALIEAVETLQGAKFIRNGTDYDAKAAADHLRLKLGKAGSQVKTAEDFIEGCASRSSVSGEKYRIRYADGREVEAGLFFYEKLKEIDHSEK